jgi:hypothetical protein
MKYASVKEVEQRLSPESNALSDEEIRAMIPFANLFNMNHAQRFKAELVAYQVRAIKRFDRSSTILSASMLILTLVNIALVIVAYCQR